MLFPLIKPFAPLLLIRLELVFMLLFELYVGFIMAVLRFEDWAEAKMLLLPPVDKKLLLL